MGKPSPPPPPPPPPPPLPPLQSPAMLLSPPQQPPQHFNLDNNNISPSILLIIVIIAIIFFISGLLHLLVRLLLRPPTQRNRDHHLDHVTVLQGQLQQLFHLHDSGVDQAYIDTLPVFFYKAIIGVKDPFDCAVCLCEFEGDDKLRLLPHCSHAFHVDCIDTWLLSHSTCPLCRASLLGGGDRGGSSTVVCVLESNSGDISAGEIDISNPSLDCQVESGSGHQVNFPSKSTDKQEEKIVNVKLGKFRNVDVVGEGTSEIDNISNNNNIDNNINNNINNNNNNNSNISGGNDDLGSRRCYSMGSFAYVLDETSSLQVPIRNTPIIKKKKQSSSHNKKANLPLRPGHRAVMSEYGCDSHREFNVENRHSIDSENGHGLISKRIESFSISKIWGRGGGERGNCNKMKGMSYYSKENNELSNSKRSVYTTNSFEINVSELGNNNDEEETQSCYSVDSLAFPTTSTTSSTTRRTLLWLMGRTNNKIVHNHSTSFSSNV